MSESFEKLANFVKPDFTYELGEFERVGSTFGIDDSALLFAAEDGRMVQLNDEVWGELENTDSYEITKGDWSKVAEYAEGQDIPRDWRGIKERFETGLDVNAPIIMKLGQKHHKVSGNTRLMVSRALGIKPTVWLFEAFENEAD